MVELRKARKGGEYTAEVGEDELTFTWKKPQTRTVMDVLPLSTTIEARGQRFMMDRQKHILGEIDDVPVMSITGEEVTEVYGFITEHVTEVEGLTVGGEAVKWSELADADQEEVLDLIGWGHCQTLFGAILESSGFSPAKKKGFDESVT